MKIRMILQTEEGEGMWVAEPTPKDLENTGPYVTFAGSNCPEKVQSIMTAAFRAVLQALQSN